MEREIGTFERLSSAVPLVWLGIAGELVYLFYFVVQFPLLGHYHSDTDIGTITGHSHGSFVLYIAAVTLLFLLFALACLQIGALAPSSPNTDTSATPDADPLAGANASQLGAHDSGARDEPMAHSPRLTAHGSLPLILGFGGLFMVTLVFVYPITATDLFSYIAQSQVLVHYHHNPIFTPPSQFPRDPLMRLSDGYFRYGSPYGPLGILLDALPVAVTGGGLLASLLLLKGLFSALALGSAYLAYAIIRPRYPRLAVGAALFIAWNPFVLLEVSVNGHNDIAMVFLILLALYALVRERLLIAVVLIALACMVKYAAVFLIPLVLLYGAGRQRTLEDRLFYVGSALAWSFAVVAVLYFPFWQGTDTLSILVNQTQRSSNSLSSILYSLRTGRLGVDQTAIVGWLIFAAVYTFALWRSVRDRESIIDQESIIDLDRLLQSCFLVLFGFLALAAGNVEGWYLLWPAMVAAVVPFAAERVCAFAFSYCTELSVVVFGYIFVWLGLDLGSIPLLNAITYALTFVPAAAVLFLFSRPTLPHTGQPT